MKQKDFLAELIGDNARARVLRVLAHADEPMTEYEIALRSTLTVKKVQKELRTLSKLKLVNSSGMRKTPQWSFNFSHTHVPQLVRFIHAVAPVQHERIIEALKKAGKLSAVIISGIFVGDKERAVDLIFAVDLLNESLAEKAVRTLEGEWGREIRYAVFPTSEIQYRLTVQDRLLRDVLDFSHTVLLDKHSILAQK